ncbi:hypothetical protein DAPPUDRAFT_104203 [Daphnia pulex]|uniref:Dendritic cell-specific transmembrane protein-like domain-containing protein n=1 Tax=Daphnia pulex TaxID=6669 RepID=E9GLJ9_DAPPU|nr:hypothetical protein DAPPUDRAFT_104203 [Daphnia pulex]|eukprot:EFX79677.1 hypothetical protein DAPPUDRAFT_104203 [Daphnia pulex]
MLLSADQVKSTNSHRSAVSVVQDLAHRNHFFKMKITCFARKRLHHLSMSSLEVHSRFFTVEQKLRVWMKKSLYTSFTRVMFDYIYIMYNYPSRFAESVRLIIKVMFCFWFEQSAKYLHHLLMNIQFVVPNYGSARFVFNVQGDGIFAVLMRAVLGGFSLESKYCKIADTSACNTAFIPVDWRTWVMLFLLAFFYFLIGLYQSKSDYIMCRICDFLIPKRGEERTEVTLEEINEERRKRSVVVEKLADEEIKHPCFDRGQNDAIISFYQPRRWYHRFMPTLILSLIAHWKLGVDSILCQICGQDIITGRFRCKTLLFCEEYVNVN